MITLAQGLFMAEIEGYLNTREGKIQKVVNELVRYHRLGFNINNHALQCKIYDECGIPTLSDREISRIKRDVERRI